MDSDIIEDDIFFDRDYKKCPGGQHNDAQTDKDQKIRLFGHIVHSFCIEST